MRKIILLLVLATLPFHIHSQWFQVTSPTSSTLYCLYFNNASTGCLSGSLNGNIIKTTNGGASWLFYTTGTSSTFYDMYFTDLLTGYVTGSTQQVIKTTNSGLNWDIKTSGSAVLYSISFPSTAIGYAVGSYPSTLVKSTDGGNNWINLVSPSTNTLRGVYFLNSLSGWICGTGGTIWKTTDGCVSWIPQQQSSSYSFEKIRFLNTTTGIVIGSNGVILRTTNGGTNWIQVSSGVTYWLYDLYFTNISTGWAVGVNGSITRTTDSGLNWYVQNTPVTSTLYGIHMVDGNTGYIVGSSGALLKTTNGGGAPVIPCFTKIMNDPVVQDNAWSEGCAWGDYDGDGDQDLVVTCYNDGCFSCVYPILFYRNDGGTFTKLTTGPIATEITASLGCSWADYDNDGKLDLFVCGAFGYNNLLYHNEGNGNFTKVTSGSIVNNGGFSVACTWIDYDKDGWLDLFVVNKGTENDFLYHNNGNGTFTQITSGTIVNDGSYGRSCTAGDYDNDGWQDIFVTCFSSQSDRLYHNNGNGTFTLTSGIIPSDNASGSGCAFADYDNDGWLDLFVSNYGNSNFLYHNNGNGTFNRIHTGPGGETTAYSFGCVWADYDNDGKIDLFVSNYNMEGFLYRNLGAGNFLKINNEAMTTGLMYGIGNTSVDYNLDGKIDFFTSNNGTSGVPQNDLLFRNNCASGNFIILKLKGCEFNKSGIGARIYLKANGNSYIREVSGGHGFHSQSMLWQHFGLGTASIVDSVIVKWTTGNIQKLTNVQANQILLVDECLLGVSNNKIPVKYELKQNYPNPFNPVTSIEYSILKTTFVNLSVFDLAGKLVKVLVNEKENSGTYKIDFDGTNFSSGVYVCKLETDEYNSLIKMVLIK